MSKAKKPSGFLKLNYDKVIVVVVLVALLISAILLILQLNQGDARIKTTQGELVALNPRPVVPIATDSLQAMIEHISTPYQIAAAQRRMLVGDLRVSSIPDGLPIPFDAAICPFTGAAQPMVDELDTDGDGMPDEWERKYGLNPFDPSDATQDMDGDGFTNLEEYLAGTDPTDPTDFPPPPAKLRLIQVRVTPFKLRFLNISQITETDVRFQLNLRTLERTYFPRMNEEVEGYTVIGFTEKGPEGLPELTLQQGDKTVRLVQGRVIDDKAYTALMVFLVDGKRYRANVGDNVTLLERDYKVIDIREDRVVIRDEEAGRDIDIGLLSDEERRQLSAGGRP